jgi:regulatory protein
MPTITKIAEQKRSPNRRSVYIDGDFAFGVNLNVVAKFRLREGMTLSAEQVDEIQRGEVRQECLDHALRLLGQRLHSRTELKKKLARREYGDAVIEQVLDNLVRLGYVDDERFAKTMALSLAQHKRVGARRAVMELVRVGVAHELAERAVNETYASTDPVADAKRLVAKQIDRLRKMDPQVARRRLSGLLQRRGYDFDTTKAVIEQSLGESPEE